MLFVLPFFKVIYSIFRLSFMFMSVLLVKSLRFNIKLAWELVRRKVILVEDMYVEKV